MLDFQIADFDSYIINTFTKEWYDQFCRDFEDHITYNKEDKTIIDGKHKYTVKDYLIDRHGKFENPYWPSYGEDQLDLMDEHGEFIPRNPAHPNYKLRTNLMFWQVTVTFDSLLITALSATTDVTQQIKLRLFIELRLENLKHVMNKEGRSFLEPLIAGLDSKIKHHLKNVPHSSMLEILEVPEPKKSTQEICEILATNKFNLSTALIHRIEPKNYQNGNSLLYDILFLDFPELIKIKAKFVLNENSMTFHKFLFSIQKILPIQHLKKLENHIVINGRPFSSGAYAAAKKRLKDSNFQPIQEILDLKNFM